MRALILAPTRELALQVSSHLNACISSVDLNTTKNEEEEVSSTSQKTKSKGKGKAKAKAEEIVLAANGQGGLYTVALRPAGIFG